MRGHDTYFLNTSPREECDCLHLENRYRVPVLVDTGITSNGWRGNGKAGEMGRTLDEVMATLPAERREAVEARFRALKDDVEGLRALREIAGKAQAEVATALGIKQPSVSKVEKQTDMYLSTLRSYVEAVGGTLDLVVTLPNHAPLRLKSVGYAMAADDAQPDVVTSEGRSRPPAARRRS
jgi:DNA-binding XRE family transcriptional regulator